MLGRELQGGSWRYMVAWEWVCETASRGKTFRSGSVIRVVRVVCDTRNRHLGKAGMTLLDHFRKAEPDGGWAREDMQQTLEAFSIAHFTSSPSPRM